MPNVYIFSNRSLTGPILVSILTHNFMLSLVCSINFSGNQLTITKPYKTAQAIACESRDLTRKFSVLMGFWRVSGIYSVI